MNDTTLEEIDFGIVSGTTKAVRKARKALGNSVDSIKDKTLLAKVVTAPELVVKKLSKKVGTTKAINSINKFVDKKLDGLEKLQDKINNPIESSTSDITRLTDRLRKINKGLSKASEMLPSDSTKINETPIHDLLQKMSDSIDGGIDQLNGKYNEVKEATKNCNNFINNILFKSKTVNKQIDKDSRFKMKCIRETLRHINKIDEIPEYDPNKNELSDIGKVLPKKYISIGLQIKTAFNTERINTELLEKSFKEFSKLAGYGYQGDYLLFLMLQKDYLLKYDIINPNRVANDSDKQISIELQRLLKKLPYSNEFLKDIKESYTTMYKRLANEQKSDFSELTNKLESINFCEE